MDIFNKANIFVTISAITYHLYIGMYIGNS